MYVRHYSHAADHTLLVRMMDEAGLHRFTVVVKAHQADIGNSIPTTYHGAVRDVYEEGALIFPCVRVRENFETNADFLRMCAMRIRVPGAVARRLPRRRLVCQSR